MTGRDAPREKQAVLVFVGETYGWLEPCGCAEGMLGGLPRRAAFLRALEARGYAPVLLDLGDLVREPGRQTELKLDALLRAYGRMPVAAVALGERDLAYLERLRASGLPLVSTAPGALRTVSTIAGPVSVREIVGPSLKAHFDQVRVTATADPAAAGPAEVVLFHGTREEARRLFAGRGGPRVIVAGHEEEYAAPAETLEDGKILLSPGDKGKYAAVVLVRKEPAGGQPRFTVLDAAVPLGDRIADDPAVAKIVDDYKERLFEEDLVTAAERKLPETGGSFVGAEACGACHEAQYAVFEKTKHVHAFESLIPRKGTRDPECLRCHSTGFGFASGFAGPEATPDLARVSCESCHGVGSNHIRNPQAGFGKLKEPPKLCRECHDKENSPNFDFGKYWPRIKH